MERESLKEQKKCRWVSVNDRLPEKGGMYVVLYQGKSLDTRQLLNGTFRFPYETQKSYSLLSHWLEFLPELPGKAEGQG